MGVSEFNINNDYYGNINNKYSTLANEVAVLQRKVYLPLLPLERMNDLVLGAYRYLGKYYWTKEDVFEAKTGNFYIPLLFPLVEDGESTTVVHSAPQVKNVATDSKLEASSYKTNNFVPVIIPRHIIMQFSNLIPKGTKFNVSFIGGSSSNYSIKINSVNETVKIPKGEFDDRLYETNNMSFSAVVSLVQENLNKIRQEEARRRKEEKRYAKLEE
jgi:hypothetical protein